MDSPISSYLKSISLTGSNNGSILRIPPEPEELPDPFEVEIDNF